MVAIISGMLYSLQDSSYALSNSTYLITERFGSVKSNDLSKAIQLARTRVRFGTHNCISLGVLFLVVVVVLGFEFRASHLLDRCSTT
jgi:hypothetical protein